jgi:serine/threonine protein kinase/tetratricopeptide (TPR) repeat protein
MGIVWLARDEQLERHVALKFLSDHITHDGALLADLKRETKRSLELTHPHIVRIYDFFQDAHYTCISMEFVDGDTLSTLRVRKPNPIFETPDLEPWLADWCQAMHYAHTRARIVHCDIKPANLMVDSKGALKITDFGIARSLSESISTFSMVRGKSGTLVYMSPQQLNGDPPSVMDDIYSMGATLYELLTSKPPFYRGQIDRQIFDRVPPSIADRRAELEIKSAFIIPMHWEETIAACLAKEPSGRPQGAAEIFRRLSLVSPLQVDRPTFTPLKVVSDTEGLQAPPKVEPLVEGYAISSVFDRITRPLSHLWTRKPRFPVFILLSGGIGIIAVVFAILYIRPRSPAIHNPKSQSPTHPIQAVTTPSTTGTPAKAELQSMYDQAFREFNANNYPQALKDLDLLDARQPDLVESHNLRGVILMRQADYDRAEVALQKALAIDSKFWNARFNLAEVPFLRKDWTGARKRFEGLLQGNAAELRGEATQLIQYKILLTYLLEGKDNMVDTMLATLELSPKTPAAQYAKAAISLQHKNEKEAKDWLTRAEKDFSPELNKLFAESLYEVGWMQRPTGQIRQALELTTAADRQAKARALAADKYEQAEQAFQQRDFAAARKLVDEADAANPAQAATVNLRGEILLAQKNFDGAENAFQQAIQLDQNLYEAQFNLAQIPFKKKDYTKARERFEALFSVTPSPNDSKNQRAQIIKLKIYLTLLVEKEDSRAQKMLEQFQFTGDTPALYYAQAAWEFKHGNAAKANDWIVSARKLYSPALNIVFADSFYDLGWLEALVPGTSLPLPDSQPSKDPEVPLSVQARVQERLLISRIEPTPMSDRLTKMSHDGREKFEQADKAFAQGQITTAQYFVDEAAKFEPSTPAILNLRGAIQMVQGNLKAAQVFFQQAAAIDPKFCEAAYNIALVEFKERKYTHARIRLEAIYSTLGFSTPENEVAQLFKFRIYLTLLLDREYSRARDVIKDFLNKDKPAFSYAEAAWEFQQHLGVVNEQIHREKAMEWMKSGEKVAASMPTYMFVDPFYDIGWLRQVDGKTEVVDTEKTQARPSATASPTPATAPSPVATPASPAGGKHDTVWAFRGKIKAVSLKAQTITVQGTKGADVFAVTSQTEISINGRSAALRNATIGAEVHGLFSITIDRKLVAISVDLGRGPLSPKRR